MTVTIGVYLGRNRPDLRQCSIGICEYIRAYDPSWHVVPGPLPQAGDTFTGIDGVVTFSPGEEASRAWRDAGIVAVNLSTKFRDPHLPQVWSDDAAIARLAVSHLIERGFGRFACFGPAGHVDARWRRDGMVRAISELGFPTSSLVLNVEDFDPSVDAGWGQKLRELLEQDPRPIGCLTYTDSAAKALLHYAKQAGAPVPQRVGVVGVNNNEYLCETRQPTVTSIDPNHRARGYEAGRMVAAMIAGETVDTPPPVPPASVVVRGSTAQATTDDPMVDRAVAFIRANARRPICVDDVVEHVNSNRVTLGRRFRQRLNTSLHHRIVHDRIEAVKELLRATDLDTQGVATAAGFASRAHLSKLFKQKTGQTLLQYRREVRHTRR